MLQVVARLLFDGGGQRFEVVGTSERIHRLGDTRFQGKNLLDTQCHAGRLLAGETKRLIVAVDVQRLGAAENGGEGLQRGAGQVVLRLLRG